MLVTLIEGVTTDEVDVNSEWTREEEEAGGGGVTRVYPGLPSSTEKNLKKSFEK